MGRGKGISVRGLKKFLEKNKKKFRPGRRGEGISPCPDRLVLPCPGFQPSLLGTIEEFVGKGHFRTGRSLEGRTEEAKLFNERSVTAPDDEQGLSDFNHCMGTKALFLRGRLCDGVFMVERRV
jgi:hypothetical protein